MNAVRKMNNKGFSLIEVMVTTAIISIVIAGLMETTRLSMLQAAASDAKNSVVSVTGYLGQIALEPVSCTAAITKSSQNYANKIRFDLPDGQVIADLADMPAYGIFVKSFDYKGAVLVGTGVDGSKAYFGTLTLAMATKRQVLGPSSYAPRAVASIYLTVNAAGKITACGSKLPTLPSAPVAPPAPPPNNDFAKGCSAIGGQMSSGNCTFHSGGEHDGHDDHSKESN